MVFEPSPVWLDDDLLATDEAAKNFLRNVLTKSKGQLSQLKRDEDHNKREVEGARRVRKNIRDGKDKRDEVEVVRAIFELQGALHDVSRQRSTAEVEISTITSAVGDVSIGARNHNFKSETFKIPTNCDYCGERIWGINAKGFTCRDCGLTCHNKCEMKCPANCPGEQNKEEKKKLKAQRQEDAKNAAVPTTNGSSADGASDMPRLSRSDTMNTLSSGYSATAQRSVSGTTITAATLAGEEDAPAKKIPAAPKGRRNRLVAPPPTQFVTSDPGLSDTGEPSLGPGETKGRMLYAYQPNSDGEIAVQDGQDVIILEADGIYPHAIPFPLKSTILTHRRRLRLAPRPPRPRRRSRTSILCRKHTAHPTPAINVFQLLSAYGVLTNRRSEEKRASCSSETRRQKTEICRGVV